jgi:hypothetical protein
VLPRCWCSGNQLHKCERHSGHALQARPLPERSRGLLFMQSCGKCRGRHLLDSKRQQRDGVCTRLLRVGGHLHTCVSWTCILCTEKKCSSCSLIYSLLNALSFFPRTAACPTDFFSFAANVTCSSPADVVAVQCNSGYYLSNGNCLGTPMYTTAETYDVASWRYDVGRAGRTHVGHSFDPK